MAGVPELKDGEVGIYLYNGAINTLSRLVNGKVMFQDVEGVAAMFAPPDQQQDRARKARQRYIREAVVETGIAEGELMNKLRDGEVVVYKAPIPLRRHGGV